MGLSADKGFSGPFSLSAGSMFKAFQSSFAVDRASTNPNCLYVEREIFCLLGV